MKVRKPAVLRPSTPLTCHNAQSPVVVVCQPGSEHASIHWNLPRLTPARKAEVTFGTAFGTKHRTKSDKTVFRYVITTVIFQVLIELNQMVKEGLFALRRQRPKTGSCGGAAEVRDLWRSMQADEDCAQSCPLGPQPIERCRAGILVEPKVVIARRPFDGHPG